MKEVPIKICILSKADSFGGGASKCAEDLSVRLNHAGHKVRHYCYWSGKGFNAIRHPLITRFYKVIFFFREKFEKKVFGLPELFPFELPFLLRGGILSYDIVHFHDICSAISPLTVYYLATRKPVVWTFHDCSSFTGGCLYPMGCEKYKTKCIKCEHKQWPIDSPFIKTSLLQKIKKNIFSNTGISLISPSQWMANMAYSASALNRIPIVINNGVDTSLYQAINKNIARKSLSLPENRYVILISAASFSDERKGFKYAIESIKRIIDLDPYIILMGNVSENLLQTELNGIDNKIFGYQSDPNIINQIYASADVFLFPSLADNQPLSILESFASGTPVVAFDVGGIPEMIDQNSGAVVIQKDVEALSQALRKFKNKEYSALASVLVRKLAIERYSMNIFLDNHINLYRTLMV